MSEDYADRLETWATTEGLGIEYEMLVAYKRSAERPADEVLMVVKAMKANNDFLMQALRKAGLLP